MFVGLKSPRVSLSHNSAGDVFNLLIIEIRVHAPHTNVFYPADNIKEFVAVC